MPKRPRQHILEDLAGSRLRKSFGECGWTIEELNEDYGLDFLVRIFEAGIVTPLAFFIQSKSTDKIEEYFQEAKDRIAYRVQSEHAAHWSEFREPIFLTV